MVPWTFASALASPLNPWGAATLEDGWGMSAFGYRYDGHTDGLGYVGVGFHGGDLWVGGGASRDDSGAVSPLALEFMPRWFIVPQLALVPHLYWTWDEDTVVAGAEVHSALLSKWVALTTNLAWRPVVGGPDRFSRGTAAALVAPELYLVPGRLSVFAEVDATWDVAGALDPVPGALLVGPGLSVLFARGHGHGLTAEVQIPTDGSPVSFGASLTYAP